jgi:signal transduction histidine kinase
MIFARLFKSLSKAMVHARSGIGSLCLILALVGWAFTPADASAQTETDLGDGYVLTLPAVIEASIDMTPNVASYVDTSRALMMRDVIALPQDAFGRTKNIPSFGYTTNIIWHQIDLHLDQAFTKPPLMEISPTYLNFIDVYLLTKGDDTPIWEAQLGDNIPASARPFPSGAQVVALPDLPAGDYRMLIRVESNSANFLRLKLWSSNDLISSLTLRSLTTNVFFGLIMTLGIAYFALGLTARDFVVSVYGIWVITVSMTVAIVNGLVLSEFQPETPWINDFLLGLNNTISHGGTVLLWLHIVGVRQWLPILYKAGVAYAIVIFAFAIGATNDLYTVFGSYIIPSHSAFMILMSVIVAVQAIRDWRNLVTWGYLLLLAVPTVPAVMIQLAHSGVIEATPARLGLHQFGVLFHLIGMAIMMAVRLAYMDKERQTITRKAHATTTLVEEQRNLISMLSHEFRTPLAVIQRSAEMLTLRLQSKTGDVLNRLQRIQMQARKLARLVDIFLAKDGIDGQEISLARELMPINRFMHDFVANTTREGAEVKLTCHQTGDCEAYMDETLVGLAITNLIETSRRFAHGAPIHIETYRRNADVIEIVIPCRGAELDNEEIRLIGDALFRRDAETKSLSKALGLHISQRIIDAHGGSIKLRDRGSHGIELCMFLPCEDTSVQEPDIPEDNI